MADKYFEYFDVDERYFPCIDESAIKAGALWENTYPHATFINMLNETERAFSRQNDGKTLWIEGAYGTGKSQCAYALRKILEVPESQLRDYWSRYEPLRKKPDLLEKIVGHKNKGIVVANRYASGGIQSSRDLFFAIQESVKTALIQQNQSYLGENTLKESVIVWLEDIDHKLMFDSLLQNPDKEWRSLFAQSTADEVLNSLRKGGEVKTLIDNIFRLADKEGITALTIDSDRLITWLTDIIDNNKIKLVLIWDEFSDYFKNNRESLSEFQKIASLVQYKPFYFIVVTHDTQQIYISEHDRGNQSKVSDRFLRIPIELPENIAFDLIGHAFKVKSAAQQEWDVIADDLNERINTSRSKVMAAYKINNHQVIKDMMPIHPMTALILKNIASSFKSNQRSMFDFIKSSNTDDVKAFQWFIENKGPIDDHPLLTVDMLWNFFYEKGKENLTSDIRLILDTFPQQQNLRLDEESVLKAILIMQAVDQRTGGQVDLFKATDQNLSYVFEGIPDLEGTKSANLAKGMKDKGILVSTPINGNRFVYTAAILAGDQSKIDKHKEDVRKNSTIKKLVDDGGLSTVLSLSPALRLRYESESGTGKISTVTSAQGDLSRTINILRDKSTNWAFQAVIAFAKDDADAVSFRRDIKNAVADKQYENIVFIDVLSSPLGAEAYEQYVEYSAMAIYYQGNNKKASEENNNTARRILDQEWRNRISAGQFVIYTYANQQGEKVNGSQSVAGILQTIVMNRFPYAYDCLMNYTESQMKSTAMRQSAKSGIIQATSGVINGIEKHVLPDVWNVEDYWENPITTSLPISKIKITINEFIEDAFNREGQVSIDEIYDFLEMKYGFAPCNVSSFLTGFLLKEYGNDPYRYSDSAGGGNPMTQDKLAEMISNYIGKNPKPTYIVKMTPEERAFYELTEKAWNIPVNLCSSANQAAIAVSKQMRKMAFPIWCLEEVDTFGVYYIIKKYIELVQFEGKEAHKKAGEIGIIAINNPSVHERLSNLLTEENCSKGMYQFLETFENGKIINIAKDIGAKNNILIDIRRLFEVKHSCLWDKQTGKDEIYKLITEYEVVKESNIILNAMAHSLNETYKVWNERLKFLKISHEVIKSKYQNLIKIVNVLLKIFKQNDILYDQLKSFNTELKLHSIDIKELFNDESIIFTEIYEPYLEDLSDDDILNIKSNLQTGMFELQQNDCNKKVKEAADEYRKNQLKTKLMNMWKEHTGTKNPREWSSRYRTPILSCVSESEYDTAKKTFDILNRNYGTDSEIKHSIEFLETAKFFEVIADDHKRNQAFGKDIVGEYRILLNDYNKVRDSLDRISIDTYEWRDNPSVKNKIKQLAESEYNAGGSDKVLSKIDDMNDSQLKQYLKRLVKDSMNFGIEILANENESGQ